MACKTGTAETSAAKDGTEEHISFIGYAPAEDPQIAVAVLLEYGKGGSFAKNVAKDLMDQYFGLYTWDKEGRRYNQSGDLVDDDGVVLKTKEELDEERATPSPDNSTAEPDDQAPEDDGEPAATPWPGRGSGIPDRIFTGEDNQPEAEPASAPEAGEASPTPQPDRSIPFYYGSGDGDSGGEPDGGVPDDEDNGDDDPGSQGDGDEPESS